MEFRVPWAKPLQTDVGFPHFSVCLQEAKTGGFV